LTETATQPPGSAGTGTKDVILINFIFAFSLPYWRLSRSRASVVTPAQGQTMMNIGCPVNCKPPRAGIAGAA
jgi:hypothetical protein